MSVSAFFVFLSVSQHVKSWVLLAVVNSAHKKVLTGIELSCPSTWNLGSIGCRLIDPLVRIPFGDLWFTWLMHSWFLLLLCFVIYGDVNAKETGKKGSCQSAATLVFTSERALDSHKCSTEANPSAAANSSLERSEVFEAHTARNGFKENSFKYKTAQGSTMALWAMQKTSQRQRGILPWLSFPLVGDSGQQLCPKQLGNGSATSMAESDQDLQITKSAWTIPEPTTVYMGLDARTMAGDAETGCCATAQRQRKGQGASLATTCLTIYACHLLWGSLDIVYGGCITATPRFGGSPQEGPGQVITGSGSALTTGTDPRFKEYHTTVACGGFPTWTSTQKPTRSGESQTYHVPILGHLRDGFFGTLDILCRGLQGQGHRAQQPDRRSKESSSQEQRELRQYAEIEWSCNRRHYGDIRRGGDCDCTRRCRTRLGCNDEWPARDEAQHGRSRDAADQETESAGTQRRWRSSENHRTGFSTGRQLRPQVLCQCPASLVWNHSVTRQPDFLTLWAACERARELAQLFGPHAPSPKFASNLQPKPRRPDIVRKVAFCSDIEVRLISHGTVAQFTTLHESLSPHPSKPWSLLPREQYTPEVHDRLVAGWSSLLHRWKDAGAIDQCGWSTVLSWDWDLGG